MLDPRLRLGLKQREMVTEMLEMGWLFTSVVRYNQTIDGEDTLSLVVILQKQTMRVWRFGGGRDCTIAVSAVPNLTAVGSTVLYDIPYIPNDLGGPYT